MPVTLLAPDGLHRKALDFADRHGLPAVYDAHSIALAEMLGCTLSTEDQRLLRTLAGSVPFVRAIGKYAARSMAGKP